jgi:acylphosphatase
MIAIRLTIHGRVQGVFYRDWTVQNARELGLAGWVRNEADGTVAAHLEGDRVAIDEMIGRMRDGPVAARVDRIDRQEVEPEGLRDFSRR